MPSNCLIKKQFPLNGAYYTYLKRICLFIDHFKYGVFLNGNEFKHGFPCEIACSNTAVIDNVTDLEKALTKQQNLYGILPYDLKNQWESLHSHNTDLLEFDDLFFFEPEVIIRLQPNGISIQSQDPDATLQQLEAIDITSETPPELQFQQRTSKKQYLETVNKIKRDILEGEVYEINYCTEFYCLQTELSPPHTYLLLNAISPTPFSSLVKNNEQWLIGASPERFIKREQNRILSQPIKGTSKRDKDPLIDLANRNHLLHSEKEKAENLMIVDLVRNDLAHHALPGTVKVDELFGIYSFRQVHQMISTISAQVAEDTPSLAIIKNAFPMGSMTGAPKIKAMELIENYEQQKRGWFSGAVGYFKPNEFDFNVVIRSLFYNANKKVLSFQVGSAITIDSDPEQEYAECKLKAKALLQCFSKQ